MLRVAVPPSRTLVTDWLEAGSQNSSDLLVAMFDARLLDPERRILGRLGVDALHREIGGVHADLSAIEKLVVAPRLHRQPVAAAIRTGTRAQQRERIVVGGQRGLALIVGIAPPPARSPATSAIPWTGCSFEPLSETTSKLLLSGACVVRHHFHLRLAVRWESRDRSAGRSACPQSRAVRRRAARSAGPAGRRSHPRSCPPPAPCWSQSARCRRQTTGAASSRARRQVNER